MTLWKLTMDPAGRKSAEPVEDEMWARWEGTATAATGGLAVLVRVDAAGQVEFVDAAGSVPPLRVVR